MIVYDVVEGIEDVTVFLDFTEVYLLDPGGGLIDVTPVSGYIVFGEGTEPPDIVVNPLEYFVQLNPGDSTNQMLTISNSGEIDLEWEINISENLLFNFVQFNSIFLDNFEN